MLVEEHRLPFLQTPASQALWAMPSAWDCHFRDVWVEFLFPEEHIRDREVEWVVDLERLMPSAEDNFQVVWDFAAMSHIIVHDVEFLSEA